MLDGDETDTFFHRTGFSGLEEQFAAFGKTPFQAGPDDGRGFRALCGVDHEAIGGKPLLPLLVQPGKVHVIAMDFGKRPGHEQFEALLEQRKIGPPIRPEEKPGKPGEQETHREREQDFPARAGISGTASEPFRPGRAKLRQEGADFGRGIGRHGFPRRLQWRSVLCCRILGRRPLLEEGKIVK